MKKTFKLFMPDLSNTYTLNNLSSKEKKVVKRFIKDLLNDLIQVRFDGIVDEMFQQLESKTFTPDDVFTFKYDTSINANVLLSGIGKAIKKRSK